MYSNAEAIIEYYTKCDNAYRDAWGLDRNMQLNLGLWKKGTKSLSEALQHLNAEIAELSGMKSSTKHLDAGCGVGGTAIFMAKNYGTNSTGINLVQHQIERAAKNAEIFKVSDSAQFHLMDYTKTDFKDETFDVVTGIESICYAEPKSAFLKEAFRILKPGGRLVLAENLQAKALLNQKEQECLYDNAFHGCGVKSLDTAEEYLTNLTKLGFKDAKCLDYTNLIKPSIKRLRRFYYPAWAYNKYHQLMGKPFSEIQLANTKMCFYLQSSLKKGLWSYGIIRAVK